MAKRTLGVKITKAGKVIKTIPSSTKKLITSTVNKAVNATEETKRLNYTIIKTGGQSISLKDTSAGGLGVPGFETSGPLYALAQGADATQRIGRKVRPISLSYRMSVNLDVNVSNDRYLDIYLVKWNDFQPLSAGGVITPINDGQFLDADLVTSFFGTMCQRNIDYKNNQILSYNPAKQHQRVSHERATITTRTSSNRRKRHRTSANRFK